jgi:hypothetical protein
MIPSILVNDSGAEVVVRYTMHRWEIAPGVLAKCRFPSSDQKSFASTVVTAHDWREAPWGAPVEGARYNWETCEAEQTLKPGTSVVIEINGACSDYEKYLKRNPTLGPTVESFALTSPAGNIELHGFEVARAFKMQRGACFFSVSRALAETGRS